MVSLEPALLSALLLTTVSSKAVFLSLFKVHLVPHYLDVFLPQRIVRRVHVGTTTRGYHHTLVPPHVGTVIVSVFIGD